jgi:hypothetical protein
MAEIAYTTSIEQPGIKHTYTWSNVTENDTCAPFEFQDLAQDISIEADDTSAWGGASLTLVGSNGGSSGAVCTAMDGSTAAWTANALFSVLQRPGSITPTFAGGSSQSVSIAMTVWYQPVG